MFFVMYVVYLHDFSFFKKFIDIEKMSSFLFQKLKYVNLAGEWEEMDIEITFMKYGTKSKGKDKSGAYLFLPDSDAKVILS